MKLQVLQLLIVSILAACSDFPERQSKSATPAQYDKIIVDSSFNQQLNFSLMDMQQADGALTNRIAEEKTATSIIFLKLNDSLDRIQGALELKCRAEKVQDTLKIDFGHHNGFTGTGFVLKMVRGYFTSVPYSYTDLVLEEPKTTVFRIEKQKLILHRSDYNFGDSIYGFLYFRSRDQNDIKYYAEGYFRTQLKYQ